MAGETSNILREYLVSLGFKVDQVGSKKTSDTLSNLDKKATSLGRAVLGAAAAVQTMVTVFAYQMEKLYYASRRADSAAGSIQAMEYGARQIGIASGTMTQALESVAMTIRTNPGMIGFMKQLGVKVDQDGVKRLHDLIDRWSKMPFALASQQAAMFGIDSKTLFMLIDQNAELKKQEAMREKMAKEMGVNSTDAAKAGQMYVKSLTELWERLGLVKDAASLQMIGTFTELSNSANLVLTDLAKVIKEYEGFEPFLDKLWEGITGKANNRRDILTDEARKRAGPEAETKNNGYAATLWEKWKNEQHKENEIIAKTVRGWIPSSWRKDGDPLKNGGAVGSPQIAPRVRTDESDKEAYMRALEHSYGLPYRMLSRVRKAESGNGKFMRSSKGAEGDFGFMPGTGKDYGLMTQEDRMDFKKAAKAAAQYMQKLLKRYGGDARLASAAYNWGPGNVQTSGLGWKPKETRDYMDKVGGPAIHQENNITVTGVTSPSETATAVADVLNDAYSDMHRQFATRAR